MTTLINLPSTLIKRICEHLAVTTRTEKHRGWYLWPESSRTDLFNLSLTNKHLNGIAKTMLLTKTFDLVDPNSQDQHDLRRLSELEQFIQMPIVASNASADLKYLVLNFAHISRRTDISAALRTPDNLSTTIDSLAVVGNKQPVDPAQRANDTRVLTAIAKFLAVAKSVEYLELHEGTQESTKFGETGIGVLSLALPSLQFLRSLSISGEGEPDGHWDASIVIRNVLKIDSLRNLKLSNIRWLKGGHTEDSSINSRIEHIEFHLCAITPSQLSCLVNHLPHLDHFVWNAATGYCRPRTKDLFSCLGFHPETNEHRFATFLLISDKGVHELGYQSDNPKGKRGPYNKHDQITYMSGTYYPVNSGSARICLDDMAMHG